MYINLFNFPRNLMREILLSYYSTLQMRIEALKSKIHEIFVRFMKVKWQN